MASLFNDIRGLAKAIDEGDVGLIPILADALQDAGIDIRALVTVLSHREDSYYFQSSEEGQYWPYGLPKSILQRLSKNKFESKGEAFVALAEALDE